MISEQAKRWWRSGSQSRHASGGWGGTEQVQLPACAVCLLHHHAAASWFVKTSATHTCTCVRHVCLVVMDRQVRQVLTWACVRRLSVQVVRGAVAL